MKSSLTHSMVLMAVHARPQPRPKPHRGFTLIELMVVLAVTAILLTLAAPSFVKLLADNRNALLTQEFVSDLQLARSEALRRGQPVTLRARYTSITTPPDSSFDDRGWQIITDKNADGAGEPPAANPPAEDGVILRQSDPVPQSTTLIRMTKNNLNGSYEPNTYAAGNYVVFNEQGEPEARLMVFFRVCVSGSDKGRLIEVLASGLISQNTNTLDCPTS